MALVNPTARRYRDRRVSSKPRARRRRARVSRDRWQVACEAAQTGRCRLRGANVGTRLASDEAADTDCLRRPVELERLGEAITLVLARRREDLTMKVHLSQANSRRLRPTRSVCRRRTLDRRPGDLVITSFYIPIQLRGRYNRIDVSRGFKWPKCLYCHNL